MTPEERQKLIDGHREIAFELEQKKINSIKNVVNAGSDLISDIFKNRRDSR